MSEPKLELYRKRLESGELVEDSPKSYDEFIQEIVDMSGKEVEKNHLSIEHAVWLGLIAAGNTAPFSGMLGKLPGHTDGEPGRLEGLAMATFEASLRVHVKGQSRKATVDLVRRAYTKRTALKGYVVALQEKGIVPEDALGKLNNGNAYASIGKDLIEVVRVLEKHKSANAKVDLYSKKDLEAIKAMGFALYADYAQDRLQHKGLSPTDILFRFFTKLKWQYAKVRKAVEFLLGDEVDVEALVPAFRAPRSSRPTPKDAIEAPPVDGADEDTTSETETAEVVETTTEVATSTPVAEETPSTTAAPEAVTAPATATPPSAEAEAPAPTSAACEVETS